MFVKQLIGLLALSSAVDSHTPRHHAKHVSAHTARANTSAHSSSGGSSLLTKRDGNPANMEWIRRWAAIGDSYTAGIGAGQALGHMLTADEVSIKGPDGVDEIRDNWRCARYDMAYPKVLERHFPSVNRDGFQYLACSGDRSEQIYQQAQALDGNLDFVTMTAGGNDLCLAKIIKDCIMMPYFGTSACNTVLNKAEENVENIITDNIKQILQALNSKMNDDGIVVVNGYAQFFDASSSNCERQAWDIFWYLPLGNSYIPLTIARRERFNSLVIKINKAIRDAVNDIADDSSIKYKVGYADWDTWVTEAVDGQMCSPSSNGDYPDRNQPEIQFIKPDTHPWFSWLGDAGRDELLRREVEGEEGLNPARLTESEKRTVNRIKAAMESRDRELERTIYDSVLYKSPDPRAAVRHRLNPRDPAPPGCPGDGGVDITFGLGMPDTIGRNFHPNAAGHVTIASFALAELMDLRSLVLGVNSPACEIKDQFRCHSSGNNRRYVSADRANKHYKEFCREVENNKPSNRINWPYNKIYDRGTPEEHEFSVLLGNDVGEFNQRECEDSFDKLINSCDKDNNPMKWKQGGKFVRGGGDYTYELNPRKSGRPWPPPREAYGRCEGWYKVFFGEYTIEGAGFATWDYGQKTLLPNMNGCYGLGTSEWKFNYYDNASNNGGYEWKATFHTPIWVRARCFNNNKVVKAAGGWTNGCKGND